MGLAPDLLLTSSTMARQLADANLSSRQTLPPQLIAQLRPDALASLRRADGSLDGVPMALMPDLACFNRRTTPSPPLTITALEQLEQRGLESGMAIEGRHLFWTAGSFGAQEAISQLLAGEPVTPARRAAIHGWLNWLQLANQTKGGVLSQQHPAADARTGAWQAGLGDVQQRQLAALARGHGSGPGSGAAAGWTCREGEPNPPREGVGAEPEDP